MRTLLIIALLGLSLTACGASAPAGPPSQATVDAAMAQIDAGLADATPTAAPAATEVPQPTSTSAPTRTPAPTPTPKPTATPKPTNTPAPTATPIPPVTIEGSGQFVTDAFTPPAPVSRVVATHGGRRNFIVKVIFPDGSEKLLINTIGDYSGTSLLITDQAGLLLEVNADGPWSFLIERVPFDSGASVAINGVGDYVSGLFEPLSSGVTPMEIAHNGQRNFIVYLHCASGSDLVQNAVGEVTGSVIVRYGDSPCLWEVQADGEWSITPR